MRVSYFTNILFLIIIISACNISPVEIAYDYDQCAYCKMIISDSRFGCELVSTKGRIYKYDAIECMLAELNANGKSHYKHILVTDFYNPKILIDGTIATYVISTDRPSPMGANISAYKNESSFFKDQNLKERKVFSLQELLDYKLSRQ